MRVRTKGMKLEVPYRKLACPVITFCLFTVTTVTLVDPSINKLEIESQTA